jgi:hypothetical protein
LYWIVVFFSLFIVDILFFNYIIKLIKFINLVQFNDQDIIFFLKNICMFWYLFLKHSVSVYLGFFFFFSKFRLIRQHKDPTRCMNKWEGVPHWKAESEFWIVHGQWYWSFVGRFEVPSKCERYSSQNITSMQDRPIWRSLAVGFVCR